MRGCYIPGYPRFSRLIPTLVVAASIAQGQGQPPKPPVQPQPTVQAPAKAPGRRPPAAQPPGAQGAGAQGLPGPQGRPRRRALDIRAQAPTPEVVTIRPREIPEFPRALLAPAIYRQPAAANASDEGRGTVVLYPGVLPIAPAVTPPRPPNPKPPAE